MRSLVIVLALVAGSLALPQKFQLNTVPRDLITDLINNTIESIRPMIPDVIEIVDESFPLPKNDILNGQFTVRGSKIGGVNKFQLTSLALNLLNMHLEFKMRFDKLSLETAYDDDLVLTTEEETIDLTGDGSLSGYAEDIEITAATDLDFENGVHIHKLAATLTIQKFNVLIEDKLDPERGHQIDAYLNENIVSIIDDHVSEIGTALSPFIEELVNAILDLLINGGGEGGIVKLI